MYLFIRSRASQHADLNGVMGAAVEGARRASEVAGIPVTPWMTFMSTDAATFGWTVMTPNLADLEAAFVALSSDQEYNRWFASIDGLFTGGFTDRLWSVLSPVPEGSGPAAYVMVVEGNASNGHLGDAMAHGLRLAETSSRISGGRTLLCSGVTGSYGSIAFITGSDSITELQRQNEAVRTSPEFVHLVDSGGAFYQPGATTTIHRRLD